MTSTLPDNTTPATHVPPRHVADRGVIESVLAKNLVDPAEDFAIGSEYYLRQSTENFTDIPALSTVIELEDDAVIFGTPYGDEIELHRADVPVARIPVGLPSSFVLPEGYVIEVFYPVPDVVATAAIERARADLVEARDMLAQAAQWKLGGSQYVSCGEVESLLYRVCEIEGELFAMYDGFCHRQFDGDVT